MAAKTCDYFNPQRVEQMSEGANLVLNLQKAAVLGWYNPT